jgi:hypothetical protein
MKWAKTNALHSFGHRCEGILALTIGRGIWMRSGGHQVWSRFTRQAKSFRGASGETFMADPTRGAAIDYGQTNLVLSGADDWFDYPALAVAGSR